MHASVFTLDFSDSMTMIYWTSLMNKNVHEITTFWVNENNNPPICSSPCVHPQQVMWNSWCFLHRSHLCGRTIGYRIQNWATEFAEQILMCLCWSFARVAVCWTAGSKTTESHVSAMWKFSRQNALSLLLDCMATTMMPFAVFVTFSQNLCVFVSLLVTVFVFAFSAVHLWQ